MPKHISPFGSWLSPISVEHVVAQKTRLQQPQWWGDTLYWSELRPEERGRCVVVCRHPDGTTEDLLAPPWNARTRVHEYGGGDFVPFSKGVVFSNFSDQHLYLKPTQGEPSALTTTDNLRFADGCIDAPRAHWIGVREDHRHGGEPTNTIASVALDGSTPSGTVLVEGSDFYASPKLSPDGTALAWISWEHPSMPWDSSRLWLASIKDDGLLGEARCVAGGPNISVIEPQWSPEGVLHYIDDRSGWWNIYSHTEDGDATALCPKPYDFGRAPWRFGNGSYGFVSEHIILCTYSVQGIWTLAQLDTTTQTLTDVKVPYHPKGYVNIQGSKAVFLGYSPTSSDALIVWDANSKTDQIVKTANTAKPDPGYLSVAEPIVFKGSGGLESHAFFYPPNNQDCAAPSGEKPPLLVWSHGGPTGMSTHALRQETQYWTSRGVAVVDVNYGGSTGFGRAYRDRLAGTWGVVDVEDCIAAARHLAQEGRVDGERLAIAGGSAGGYTTLCALTFHNDFKAGASHFGVSDLEALTRDTHKFESRYCDYLVGPYPETKALYRERSPVHFPDKLSCPVIFFQGLEDKVVPPNQAEVMVQALRDRGLPVAYIAFEGEQHGFRISENIKRVLEAEFYFYARVFGFEPADTIDPVNIENLE